MSNSSLSKKYSAPDSICDDVFFDGKTLFVVTTKEYDQVVGEYIDGLRRVHKLDFNIDYVSREVVSKKHSSATKNEDSTESEEKLLALIKEAVEIGTSDIHVDADNINGVSKVRMRVHGDLEDIKNNEDEKYALHIGNAIYRLTDKTASKNGVFDPNVSLQARIRKSNKLPDEVFGIRVQNVASNTGNRLVLRVLSDTTGSQDLSLKSLGFSNDDLKVMQMFTKSVHGMILFSGPTGSGKTTSLHRYLTHYNRYHKRTRSIYTIEDPVELQIEDALQTEIPYCETEEERAQAFLSLLNDALRADPDLIMAGEIRDEAAATVALRAALTGHQVLATVHANTPLGILQRLIDIGVSSSLVYDPDTVIGLVAQRLVRILCDNCKERLIDTRDQYIHEEYQRIMSTGINAENAFVKGCGCEKCNHRGFVGREVVAQVIRTDQKLMEFLKKDDVIGALNHIRNDIKSESMIHQTIRKVNEGRVDPFDAESQVGLLNMDIINNDHQISMNEITQNLSTAED